jgi:hypothetical protein
MTTRSLPDARAAFESGNPLASRDAHTKMSIEESGHHTGDSSIGLGLFHGSLEGLSTSTLLLIVSYTSGVPPQAAWRLCSCACAGLAALAGLRSWLRHGAHARMYWREHARESWELQHYPEGESREMVELWEAWGVPHAAAETAIAALLPSRAFFVDLMMAQELKMQPVEWGGKAAVPAGLWHARRQPLSHTRHTRTHTHAHAPRTPTSLMPQPGGQQQQQPWALQPSQPPPSLQPTSCTPPPQCWAPVQQPSPGGGCSWPFHCSPWPCACCCWRQCTPGPCQRST